MVTRMRIAFVAMMAFVAGIAHANSGTVIQLAGTLSVQKADGSVRILALKSEIRSGDTLITQRDSYARVRFADGGEVTLKPNSSLKIEKLVYNESEPRNDAIHLSLLRGGVRAATGLVGKRGSPDAYRFKTSSGVIGLRASTQLKEGCAVSECRGAEEPVVVSEVDSELSKRGSSFVVEDCATGRCDLNLKTSIVVSVIHGEVVAANEAGFERFLAGESGVIENGDRPPRFLLSDPGLQFTPPASFIQSVSGGAAVNTGGSKECVVRR
jgi:hypothetical protein